MVQKVIFVVVVVLASFLVVLPVLASAPELGVVAEGQSVPGVNLGDSRALVEAAYGSPASCQNLPYYDGRSGLDGICDFVVDGGGQVTIHYRDADGSEAKGSPDDIVFNVRWSEQVDGWVTSAGVNTTLALEDPDAAIAAYPNATVIYNPTFGNIESIEDRELGILIDYSFQYLSGTLHVSMSISFPSDPLPDPEPEPITRVSDIELSLNKVKRNRQVRALVRVQNEWDLAASGADVLATWVYPDGRTEQVVDQTSGSGYAYFEILDAPRGSMTLVIDDVVLEGHVFDRDNSVLEASIKVK